jgi:fibronectin type 3 domain-containing protein
MKSNIIPIISGMLLVFGLVFPNFISTSSAEEVTIAWDANTEADLDEYLVYCSSASSGPPYELVGKLYLDELADPDNPDITLTDLDAGKEYYIVVTACDRAGNESNYSREICVKIMDGSIIDCTPAIVSGSTEGM